MYRGFLVAPEGRACGVEPGIAHVVVTGAAACLVFCIERRQDRDHTIGVITHRPVATDQVGVDVAQPGAAAFEPACGVEVEKNGAAADERLEVALELGGVVLPQGRKELPLATGPLEQRASRGEE